MQDPIIAAIYQKQRQGEALSPQEFKLLCIYFYQKQHTRQEINYGQK